MQHCDEESEVLAFTCFDTYHMSTCRVKPISSSNLHLLLLIDRSRGGPSVLSLICPLFEDIYPVFIPLLIIHICTCFFLFKDTEVHWSPPSSFWVRDRATPCIFLDRGKKLKYSEKIHTSTGQEPWSNYRWMQVHVQIVSGTKYKSPPSMKIRAEGGLNDAEGLDSS